MNGKPRMLEALIHDRSGYRIHLIFSRVCLIRSDKHRRIMATEDHRITVSEGELDVDIGLFQLIRTHPYGGAVWAFIPSILN